MAAPIRFPISVRLDIVDGATSATALEISTVVTGRGAATLQPAGQLDATNAHLLVTALERQVAAGRASLRLDLSRLTFCDCAGLGAIVEGHNRMLQAGGELILLDAGSRITRLLRLARLDGALFVADGLVAAPGPKAGRHLREASSDGRAS